MDSNRNLFIIRSKRKPHPPAQQPKYSLTLAIMRYREKLDKRWAGSRTSFRNVHMDAFTIHICLRLNDSFQDLMKKHSIIRYIIGIVDKADKFNVMR